MPPRLRVVAHNDRHEARLKAELSSSLAAVIRQRPHLSVKEAMWNLATEMISNNPFEPPKDGKSPINNLPAEILANIFQCGVEEERLDIYDQEEEDSEDEEDYSDISIDDEDDGSDMEVDTGSSHPHASCSGKCDSDDEEVEVELPFQVLVSHVCTRWREVSLGTPNLWTYLVFAKRHPRGLEKAKHYIERSATVPLVIFIDCLLSEGMDEKDHPEHPLYEQHKIRKQQALKEQLAGKSLKIVEDEPVEDEPVEFYSHKELSEIMDLLEPEAYRWKDLDFRASTYSYIQILLSRISKISAAPKLESLQLSHIEDCLDYEFFTGDDKTLYLPFHGNAPALKLAVFWGVHIDWEAASKALLTNLKGLELCFHAKDVRPSYNAFRSIIVGSPELDELTLSLSGPALSNSAAFDSEDEWGSTPLHIPSLTGLGLQFHDLPYACALIQHLDVPNVTSLLLNYDQDFTQFVQTLVQPVKGRKENILSRLEKLKISGLACDIKSTDLLLSQLQNLKEFSIKVMGDEEELLLKKLKDPKALPKGVAPDVNAHVYPKAYLPNLRSLSTCHVEGSTVKAIVKARKKAGVPLKRVAMSTHDDLDDEDERWLTNHLDDFELFTPSDSEDDEEDELIEVPTDEEDLGDVDEDEDAWEDEESTEEEDSSSDDDDGPGGVPLFSPLARHIGRTGRRHNRTTLD